MKDELAILDGTAQADLVRRGELTPAELVDAAIARIEEVNPQLNAVVIPLFEKARQQAAAADLPDGPFRGVPFLLKNLDAFSAGDPFDAGTRFLRNLRWVADHDTHLVSKLRAAGFIILGKTNTPEFGLNVTTEPVTYGASRNPWNTAHSTGGSSGGSAAAVAAGMVPAAHASDGGGSIRIPASECALVGLKPSRGRVSLGPDHGEYWHGLVISHALTRSVRDSASILDAIAGPMPGDPYTAPTPARPFAAEVGADPGQLRIGVLATMPGGSSTLHPDCARATKEAAALLESLGHKIENSHPAALDECEESTAHFTMLLMSWVDATLSMWAAKTAKTPGPDDVEPGTWRFATMGREISAAQYICAVDWLHAYTRRVARWWADGFDLLLTPTLGAPPPRLGELVPPPDDPLAGSERALALIPFTPPFNITGQPAISLPPYWNDEGLPIGVQLVAAYGREDLLIRVAAQLEQARPWHDRRPPVHA
ncbi:MAG: amidase [Candidatus Binatia bacterium]